MSYRYSHLLPTIARQFPVVSLQQHIHDSLAIASGPFTSARWWRLWLRKLLLIAARSVEALTGRTLYVEDTLGALRAFRPETRSFLAWCDQNGYLRQWEYNLLRPFYPKICTLNLSATKFSSPSGRKFPFYGTVGSGGGLTLEQAVQTSLGEFVERWSVADWRSENDLRTGTYQKLINDGAIDPQRLMIYTQDQDPSAALQEETMLSWVSGTNALTKQRVLLPAAGQYLFFNREHPHEPVFRESNTNGTAAHVNTTKASLSATLELVERDAFLRMWYQKQIPEQLPLTTVQSLAPHLKTILEELAVCGVTTQFIDISTDLKLPVLALVTTTKQGPYGVRVHVACGLNPASLFEQLVVDALKSLHAQQSQVHQETKEQLLREYHSGSVLRSIEDRSRLWNLHEMATEVAWLTTGPQYTQREFLSRHENAFGVGKTNTQAQYAFVLERFRQAECSLYLIGMTGPIARRAGLQVVRAVSPELIPMFFNEQKPPRNCRRFTHNEAGQEVQHNATPHPFV
ncbi:MAG: YcaO-like family protein [Patescibacteria group bacterium]